MKFYELDQAEQELLDQVEAGTLKPVRNQAKVRETLVTAARQTGNKTRNIKSLEVATLAGGCFWCTEAVFKRLKGVVEVTPGYLGGEKPNPTYDEVCGGETGHAEAVQITFDPAIISFEKLLAVFWAIHDPTTLNRQGNDVGTQYRSVIFYHNEAQQKAAEKSIEKLYNSGKLADPVVTELTPATSFYPAETYHRDYYDSNRGNSYCRLVIDPKVQKLFKDFKTDLKTDTEL